MMKRITFNDKPRLLQMEYVKIIYIHSIYIWTEFYTMRPYVRTIM